MEKQNRYRTGDPKPLAMDKVAVETKNSAAAEEMKV